MLCFAFSIFSLSALYTTKPTHISLTHEGAMRTKSGQIYEENLNKQSILRLFLSNYTFPTHTRNAGTLQDDQHPMRENRCLGCHSTSKADP